MKNREKMNGTAAGDSWLRCLSDFYLPNRIDRNEASSTIVDLCSFGGGVVRMGALHSAEAETHAKGSGLGRQNCR